MGEEQDIRNAIMNKFNLVEAAEDKPLPPKTAEELVESAPPSSIAPAGDSAYDAPGDLPTVGEMMKAVIENSAAAAEEGAMPLTQAERKKISERCLDVDLINDILSN